MGSIEKSEIGAIYAITKEATPIKKYLIKMDHPQPPTPIKVDNYAAVGVVKKSIKQKISKPVDMRFYWFTYHT